MDTEGEQCAKDHAVSEVSRARFCTQEAQLQSQFSDLLLYWLSMGMFVYLRLGIQSALTVWNGDFSGAVPKAFLKSTIQKKTSHYKLKKKSLTIENLEYILL